VSEHLCQGDWEAKFQQGNSSLWQIWPRVSGHFFSDFLPRRTVTCVVRTGQCRKYSDTSTRKQVVRVTVIAIQVSATRDCQQVCKFEDFFRFC
jgi:hypothetical protein